MTKLIPLLFLFFINVMLLSCKKNSSPLEYRNTPTSFGQVFDEFWNKMNTNYVYWDIDTTNWDNMYNIYKPAFEQLNLSDNNDIKKAMEYFKKITGGLIDCHYNINFKPSNIANTYIFPALDRKLKKSDFHSPFVYMSIDSSYFDRGFVFGNYVSSNGQNVFALTSTINKKILYFYCNQFALKEAYTKNNDVQKTLQFFFSQLQNQSQNIKGIIIDVRNNSGGDIADLNFLIGRFINKPLLFGYTHYKSGTGRLNYTPWIEAKIQPQPDGKIFNIPIIALADNYSMSLSEAVIIAIHTLPNGVFVGENTWGATGPVTENVVYNDGQFSVSDFLSVYTSSAAFKYINGEKYENTGVAPDINVPFNINNLQNGRDSQLEKAISLIK